MWGRSWTMWQCLGGRRRTKHQRIPWSEEDSLLLGEESQVILNPCFLDAGKYEHHMAVLGIFTSALLHLPFCYNAVNVSKHSTLELR